MQRIKKCKREKGIELFLARSQVVPGIPSYFRERRNNLRAIIHYENFNILLAGALSSERLPKRGNSVMPGHHGIRQNFALKNATLLSLDHCTQKAFRSFAGSPESRTLKLHWCIFAEKINDLFCRFRTIYS